MTTEATATIMIIILCWMILTALDAVVGGLLSLCCGITFKKAFLWGLLSLLLPPVFIASGAIWERNRFEVKEICLNFEDLPESFDNYRIVHISDIHARSFEGREEHLRKAV